MSPSDALSSRFKPCSISKSITSLPRCQEAPEMVGTPLTLNLLEDQGWANKKMQEKSIGMSFPQVIGKTIVAHQKAT